MVKFCYKIVIRIGDVMKKGFTLIELLAVITIMGLLAVIMIPKILERVDNDNQKVDEAKVSLIKSAADTYISKNINDYPNTLNNVYCISLSDLDDSGLIMVDISDVIDNGYAYVKASIKENGNLYSLTEKCQEVKN